MTKNIPIHKERAGCPFIQICRSQGSEDGSGGVLFFYKYVAPNGAKILSAKSLDTDEICATDMLLLAEQRDFHHSL